jgi:hypothetical protein
MTLQIVLIRLPVLDGPNRTSLLPSLVLPACVQQLGPYLIPPLGTLVFATDVRLNRVLMVGGGAASGSRTAEPLNAALRSG